MSCKRRDRNRHCRRLVCYSPEEALLLGGSNADPALDPNRKPITGAKTADCPVLASKSRKKEKRKRTKAKKESLLQEIKQIQRRRGWLRLLFGSQQCLQSALLPRLGSFLTVGVVCRLVDGLFRTRLLRDSLVCRGCRSRFRLFQCSSSSSSPGWEFGTNRLFSMRFDRPATTAETLVDRGPV